MLLGSELFFSKTGRRHTRMEISEYKVPSSVMYSKLVVNLSMNSYEIRSGVEFSSNMLINKMKASPAMSSSLVISKYLTNVFGNYILLKN